MIKQSWVSHRLKTIDKKKGLTTHGEYKQRQAGNLLLSLWQDNKTVSVISINCQPGVGVCC